MKTLESCKLIGLSLLFAVGLSACDNTRDNDNRGMSGTTGTDNAGRSTSGTNNAGVSGTNNTAATDTETAGRKLDRATDQAGAAIDDAAITAKVKAALIAEPGLSAMQIDVDTDKGVVTLSGSVDSLSTSEKAKTLADSVAGVKEVQNRLELKS